MSANEKYSPWIKYDLSKWDGLLLDKYLITVREKTILYTQQEDIDYVFVVKKGRVRLSYFTDDGEEKIYFFCLSGAMFGEESCFETEEQFLHAATIINCQLYKIPKDDFLQLINSNTRLQIEIIRSMAHKQYINMEQIKRLSFSNSYSRVAAVFNDLAYVFGEECEDGIQIELPIIQQGIANLINTSRLTVNKIIIDMKEKGILSKKNNRFIIYDIEKLKNLCRDE